MSSKKETLKDILDKASSIFDLDDLYSRDMKYWEDENKNILAVSPACEKITGYTADEYLLNPKLFKSLILSEDIKIWNERCKHVYINDIKKIQFRIKHKLGKTVWLEHNAQKIYNSEKEFIGIRSSNRNITNQKLTDEIINSSSSVLFLWKNVKGYPVEFVSSNVENILGYSMEEFLTGAVSFNQIIHPECVARVNTEIDYNIRVRDKKFEHKPYRVITKDNRIIWVSDNTVIKEDPNGKITHFHGIITDITKNYIIEEKLISNEQQFRFSLEAAKIGSWGFSFATGKLNWSSQIEKIFGLEKGEFEGTREAFYKHIHHEDKLRVVNSVTEAIREKKYYEIEHRIVRKDGTIKWVLQQGKVFFDSDNIPHKMFGIIRDVTERRQGQKLQKALYDISEEANKTTSMAELYGKLHEIIKTLMPANNFYIAIHNIKTNLLTFPYYSDEYDDLPKDRLFGNGLTESILRSKKNRVFTAEDFEEISKTTNIHGKLPVVWIGIYLKFEGNYRGVLVLQDYQNSNAYSDEHLKIIQFVSEQIIKVLDKRYADRRLQESIVELSKSKKELEIINSNKDRFFSIIAHDLRAPFNTLLGVTEMVSGDIDEMSKNEMKDIFDIIHSSTDNLFKLIENLLNWSRLQMGTFHISPEVLSINMILLETLEIVKYFAKEKSIIIENNIADTQVYADAECMKTVLRNLINNAIKFTHKNGKIVITSLILETHYQISVEDTGVGMSDEVVSNLFDITQKTSTLGTENEKGTGLGLMLCKDLVEKNNGQIWVESKSNKGSKFSFTIPIKTDK